MLWKLTFLYIMAVLFCRNPSDGPLIKNLGRLWLAYTGLQGDFYMLQLMSVESRHFTRPELCQGWSDLHEIKGISFCISDPD